MKTTPFYTGTDIQHVDKPEGRVNLWPLAYWHEPVGSVLWPMVSFSDDHFAFRPFYSQYKQDGKDGNYDEYNILWPFCQLDFRNHDYSVFPVFWGKHDDVHWYHIFFPLWIWKSYDDTFTTPLYCQWGRAGTTNYAIAYGLAGFSTGEKGGEWLIPIWYRDTDRDYAESVKILEQDRLPDHIQFWTELTTNYVWTGTNNTYKHVVENVRMATKIQKDNDSIMPLLPWVWYDGLYGDLVDKPNTYQIWRNVRRGNPYLTFYESTRTIEFDSMTRSKTGDQEERRILVFCPFYSYVRKTDKLADTYYSRHRILLWLWDREEKDGDVALDIFPGVTYGSKKNGYRKFSVFWRLFRYETDPEKGVSSDFLFIPICRP